MISTRSWASATFGLISAMACYAGCSKGSSDEGGLGETQVDASVDSVAPSPTTSRPSTPGVDSGNESDGGAGSRCSEPSDCKPASRCEIGKCDNLRCVFTPKECTTTECRQSACNPSDGTCEISNKPEGSLCQYGECKNGECSVLPRCGGSGIRPIQCGSVRNATITDNGGVTDYATCGVTGESSDEVDYIFEPTADATVTATLVPVLDAGAVGDLDLLVLEGISCNTRTPCANNGAAKGITVGTANETVTFPAKKGSKYFVVVDGKAGATGRYELTINCQ